MVIPGFQTPAPTYILSYGPSEAISSGESTAETIKQTSAAMVTVSTFSDPTQTVAPATSQAPPPILTRIKNLVCSAIPDARTLNLSGGIGAVGSTQGSLQASLDYGTGRTSFSASGGFQLGWNGVASAQLSMGFVYGSSNSNRSVTYSGGTAVSGYLSSSGNAREYGVGFGVSLTEGVGGGRTVSLSTPSVGNIPGLQTPLDSVLILAKQVCH